MISMYAEYSGRTLYVCLSTDNNADDFKGAKNGDTMYHMDTGKRYVYNEVDKAFHELPEEGGGGGGGLYPNVNVTFQRDSSTGTSALPMDTVALDEDNSVYIGTHHLLPKSGTYEFTTLLQNDNIVVRFSRSITKILYNGNDLRVTFWFVETNNYYAKIPYQGSEYPYIVYS